MPARRVDFSRINSLSNLSAGQKFYEFGCGDGRVCRYMAANNPQAQITGIEIYLPVFVWAKIYSFFANYKNLDIKYGNGFANNLSQEDVIFIFALPKTINHALKDKFRKELKIGAKLISYTFAINDWTGKTVVDKSATEKTSIYSYSL